MTFVLFAGFTVQVAFLLAMYAGMRRVLQKSRDAPSLPDTESVTGAPDGRDTPEPVSVVVAARNEERALPDLFAALRRLEFEEFEVIIVNDGSTDRTGEIAEAEAQGDARFRTVHLSHEGPRGKKRALTAGIAAARHDVLAFTDADCRPPPGWLRALTALHDGDPESGVIAGFSPFLRGAGFLNRFARYENLMTAAQMAAGAGLGQPFLALGRNLSFRRCLFFRAGGYRHSIRSLSGDDDLFVQHIVRHRLGPVRVMADSSGTVPTLAPEDLGAWIRQKRRHASAGRFYPAGWKITLALYHASNLTLWIGCVIGGIPGLLLLGSRLSLLVGAVAPLARRLAQLDMLLWTPLMEFLYMTHTVTVSLAGVLRMPRRW